VGKIGRLSVDRFFGNPTVDFLAKSLDTRTVAHKTFANNLANINTPGFKGTTVAFKDQLMRAYREETDTLPLKTSYGQHISNGVPFTIDDVRPQLIVDPLTSMRPDGNNVDIDQQMASMAQNTIEINALTRMISDKLRGMRQVIEGR
jgi:flagellar basal-body rod protein FlgB